MNATVIAAVLGCAGVVVTGLVTFLGKRGETAQTGYSSLTKDLLAERAESKAERAELKAEIADLKAQVTQRDSRIAEQAAALAEKSELRAADQAELTRLRELVIQLGGTL